MEILRSVDSEHARITLAGRFDFHAHRDFRQCSDAVLAEAGVKEVDVNFARVDYLDSSALGLLLLLKEKAEGQGKRIVLSGVQGTVKQILDIANFGKLFTLRD